MKKQGVELYRFIMTIIICLHHFRLYAETTLPYGGGYLAVDFFFILSGYFLYEHSLNRTGDRKLKSMRETMAYTADRYKRLFPEYAVAFIFSTIVYVWVIRNNLNLIQIGLLLAKFFMLDGFWVQMMLNVMPQGWYCSALWIGSAFVYFLAIRYGEKFVNGGSLIISIVIYVFLFMRYGFLNLYTQYGFGLTVGCFRGIAGLCLGCTLGNMIDSAKEKHIKSRLINVVIFISLTIIVLYVLLWDTAYRKSDYVMIFVFVGILFYLLSNNNISEFFDQFELAGLGNISYKMFLIHHAVAVLVDYFDWFRNYDWKLASAAYLVVVVICSFLFGKIMRVSRVVMDKICGDNGR